MAIQNGNLAPTTRCSSRDGEWWTASFLLKETVDGYERRISADQDYRNEADEEAPSPPATLIRQLAAVIKDMADGLHAAVDNPAYMQAFGPPNS